MSLIKNNQDALCENLWRVLAVFSALGVILLVGWVLKYSAYGLDFTDEGFYLVWISNPFNYSGSITQFGFLYHPLFNVLGGDIVSLRRVNFLFTYVLAWILSYLFLRFIASGVKEEKIYALVAAAGLATSVFMLPLWLPTPNYNSLALQALLLAAIGFVLVENNVSYRSVVGWLLVGVGGWLAFMAKPSTALALALSVLVYLVVSRKYSISGVLIAVLSTVFLMVLSALLIDGSVFGFWERLRLGLEISSFLDGGHAWTQMIRVDEFWLEETAQYTLVGILLVLLLVLWGLCCNGKRGKLIGFFALVSGAILAALLTRSVVEHKLDLGQFQGLIVFGVVYASLSAGVIFGGLKELKGVPISKWAVAGLFLILPYVYVFGTNGNYWQMSSAAAIFWLLAGVVFMKPLIQQQKSFRIILPVAIFTQFVAAILLQVSLESPYRQPESLRFNSSALKLNASNSALILTDEYSKYIDVAIYEARKAGFQDRSPMIDMSGQSPGLLYALGAESIGQAWIIGGYPNSLKFAKFVLGQVSCEKIAKAWILLEPNGPRSLSTELFDELGLIFPDGYIKISTWPVANGAGGYAIPRAQELYRPLNVNDMIESCRFLRRGQQQ